jgi:hypothetical protein
VSHHIKGETKDMGMKDMAKPASKAKAAPSKTSAKGGAKKK